MRIVLAGSLLAFSILGALTMVTPAFADSAIEEMRSTEAPSTAPAMDQSNVDAVPQHRLRSQHEGQRIIRR